MYIVYAYCILPAPKVIHKHLQYTHGAIHTPHNAHTARAQEYEHEFPHITYSGAQITHPHSTTATDRQAESAII